MQASTPVVLPNRYSSYKFALEKTPSLKNEYYNAFFHQPVRLGLEFKFLLPD
jgi:hypothetical protein